MTRSRIRQHAGEYSRILASRILASPRILANAATNEWRRTCETVIEGPLVEHLMIGRNSNGGVGLLCGNPAAGAWPPSSVEFTLDVDPCNMH